MKFMLEVISHLSGSIFFSHWLLRASSAVIRFSGSSVNILSNKSSAESGMYAKSSLNRLRYCFFGWRVLKCGNLMTFGQTAGVGDPQSREIISNWSGSELPWNKVFFAKSSPSIQPTDQMSIEGPYLEGFWVNLSFKKEFKLTSLHPIKAPVVGTTAL